MIRFVDGKPSKVWFSQHSGGQAFKYDVLDKYDGGLRVSFSRLSRSQHIILTTINSPSPTAQTAPTQSTPPTATTPTASPTSTSPKASSRTTPRRVHAGTPPYQHTTTPTTKTPKGSRRTTRSKFFFENPPTLPPFFHAREHLPNACETETPPAGSLSPATGATSNTPRTTTSRSASWASTSCACTPTGPRGRRTSS